MADEDLQGYVPGLIPATDKRLGRTRAREEAIEIRGFVVGVVVGVLLALCGLGACASFVAHEGDAKGGIMFESQEQHRRGR